MCRLDVMEEAMREGAPPDEPTYGHREVAEAVSLLRLLWNAGFASGDSGATDRFLRCFGQEYFLRERAGALDPALRNYVRGMLEESRTRVVGERGEPLLLLRPCAASRAGVACYGCRLKESREAEFDTCACRRAAYCGPMCRRAHAHAHAGRCAFAQQVQQRNGTG